MSAGKAGVFWGLEEASIAEYLLVTKVQQYRSAQGEREGRWVGSYPATQQTLQDREKGNQVVLRRRETPTMTLALGWVQATWESQSDLPPTWGQHRSWTCTWLS
jgi:hypothetical protein